MLRRRLKRIEQQLLEHNNDESLSSGEKAAAEKGLQTPPRSSSCERGYAAYSTAKNVHQENHPSQMISQPDHSINLPSTSRRFRLHSRFNRLRNELTEDEEPSPKLLSRSHTAGNKINDMEDVGRTPQQNFSSRRQANCHRNTASAQFMKPSRDRIKICTQYSVESNDSNTAQSEASSSLYRVALWDDDASSDDSIDDESNFSRPKSNAPTRNKRSYLKTDCFYKGEKQRSKLGDIESLPEDQLVAKKIEERPLMTHKNTGKRPHRSPANIRMKRNLSALDSLQLSSPHRVSNVASSAQEDTSTPITISKKVSYLSSDEESIDLLEFSRIAERRQRTLAQNVAVGEKIQKEGSVEGEENISRCRQNENTLEFYTRYLDKSTKKISNQRTCGSDETDEDIIIDRCGKPAGSSVMRERNTVPKRCHSVEGNTTTKMSESVLNTAKKSCHLSFINSVEVMSDLLASDEELTLGIHSTRNYGDGDATMNTSSKKSLYDFEQQFPLENCSAKGFTPSFESNGELSKNATTSISPKNSSCDFKQRSSTKKYSIVVFTSSFEINGELANTPMPSCDLPTMSDEGSPKIEECGADVIASNSSNKYKTHANHHSPSPNVLYSPGWIIKQPEEKLDIFLRDNKPSFKSIFYGDKWIYVNNEKHCGVAHGTSDSEILGQGQIILDNLEEELKNCKRGDKKIIRATAKVRLLRLAISYQKTVGKWLLFVSKRDGKVDQVWERVARNTVCGRLGCSAKVATFDPDPGEEGHVICVYVDNFYDLENVRRVYHCLKMLGLNSKSFKLDLYTELGIKSRNKWGLPVSLFTARTIMDDSLEEGIRKICGAQKIK